LIAWLAAASLFVAFPTASATAEQPAGASATKAPTAASAPAGLSLAIESLHLGSIYTYYNPPTGSRFLAVQLKITNHGSKPVAIRPQDVVLRCDGTDYKLKDPIGGLRNSAFQVRGRTVMISKLQPTADLPIASDNSAEKWFVFGGLPAGNQVPPMALRIASGGSSQEID